MQQMSFFDDEFARDMEVKRLSRCTDPETSKKAAATLALDNMRGRALDAVRTHPGWTARELDQHCGWDVHKRLCELARLELIRRGDTRKCRATGFSAGTWYAV